MSDNDEAWAARRVETRRLMNRLRRIGLLAATLPADARECICRIAEPEECGGSSIIGLAAALESDDVNDTVDSFEEGDTNNPDRNFISCTCNCDLATVRRALQAQVDDRRNVEEAMNKMDTLWHRNQRQNASLWVRVTRAQMEIKRMAQRITPTNSNQSITSRVAV